MIKKLMTAVFVAGIAGGVHSACASEDLAAILGPAVGKEIIIQGTLPKGIQFDAVAYYESKAGCTTRSSEWDYIQTPIGDMTMPWHNYSAPYPKPDYIHGQPSYSRNGTYIVVFPLMAEGAPCFQALGDITIELPSRAPGERKRVVIHFQPMGASVPLTYIDDKYNITYKCSPGRCVYASGEPAVSEKSLEPASWEDHYMQRYSDFADLGSKTYTLNITE